MPLFPRWRRVCCTGYEVVTIQVQTAYGGTPRHDLGASGQVHGRLRTVCDLAAAGLRLDDAVRWLQRGGNDGHAAGRPRASDWLERDDQLELAPTRFEPGADECNDPVHQRLIALW